MIYVFETSVKKKKEMRGLKLHLNELLKQDKWNFDLEDCDKILRIDALTDPKSAVIELLQSRGFYCAELTD